MILLFLHVMLALPPGSSQPASFEWLPASTQTVVVVNDLKRSWQLYHAGERQGTGSAFQDRFAILPGELADAVVGEFVRAELIDSQAAATEVAIAHVHEKFDAALKTIHDRLGRAGAQVTVKTFGSQPVTVVQRRDESGTERVSIHWFQHGRFLMADSLAAAEAIIKHAETSRGQGLLSRKGFVEIWQQCSPPLADEALAIAWYSDPWLAFQRRQDVAAEDAVSRDYQFAERHGISGIIGLGGSVVFGAGEAQTIQTFAHAPAPLSSSMQMLLQLTGTDDLRIPTWVSETVSEVSVLHGRIDKALEYVGPLFDDGFAEGAEGTYDEVLLDLEDLLELNLKKQLYPLCGPNLYVLQGAADERTWQPLLVALEVKDAEQFAEILRLLIADDPEATEVVLGSDSDRVWHVPGKRGGRDFVLGMLRGVAVYANDLEFAKKALRFDESKAFASADQLLAARHHASEGITLQPSILLVRKPVPKEQQAQAHPLDLVFQGPAFFAAKEMDNSGPMQWLPHRLTMLLARHPLILGFRETAGWRFVARMPDEAQGEFRGFSDVRGRRVLAKIIRVGDDQVTLKRKDGKQFTASLQVFSPADQAFLRELANAVSAGEQRHDQ